MLRIAIPNKGALSEACVDLLRESGYKCRRHSRELVVYDRAHDIEFIFLRPRDIAVYVGNGVIELGVTGRDLAADSMARVSELCELGFGKSRFCYAAPKGSALTPDRLHDLRIATSYPAIVREDLKKRGVEARVVRLDGAVEISIQLGVADVIADVVESGQTLKEAGLELIGEPILESQAVLVARGSDYAEQPEARELIERVKGVLVARAYCMIEYDVERGKLERACAITPGIESPTISPLSKEGWAAVKAMLPRADMHKVMSELSALGAKGIVSSEITACRI